MTLLLHEIKRNRLSLIIWSMAISFMLGICILIYPEMKSEMQEVTDIFANMGSFTDAFGMNQVSFGEFKGYFAVECGNVLGLGGAFFAALAGISALSKEEKEHTAEFLLTHPLTRTKIITEKLASVYAQIIVLNVIVAAVSLAGMAIIGESGDAMTIFLLFLSYFVLQIEISSLAFGISAFVKNGGLGIGLGMAFIFYFLNIVSNLAKEAEFLKYVTPFAYADGSSVVSNEAIEIKYLLVGVIFALVGIAAAYIKYAKKDIS